MAQLCTFYWLIWTLYKPPFKAVPSICFVTPEYRFFSLFHLGVSARMDPQPVMLAWGKSQRNHTEHIAFIVLLIFQLIYTCTSKMQNTWMICITYHIANLHTKYVSVSIYNSIYKLYKSRHKFYCGMQILGDVQVFCKYRLQLRFYLLLTWDAFGRPLYLLFLNMYQYSIDRIR